MRLVQPLSYWDGSLRYSVHHFVEVGHLELADLLEILSWPAWWLMDGEVKVHIVEPTCLLLSARLEAQMYCSRELLALDRRVFVVELTEGSAAWAREWQSCWCCWAVMALYTTADGGAWQSWEAQCSADWASA